MEVIQTKKDLKQQYWIKSYCQLSVDCGFRKIDTKL